MLIIGVAAAAIAAAAPASAPAQAPAEQVGEVKVESGTLLLASRFRVEVKFNTTLGLTQSPPPPTGNGQEFWFFSDQNLEFLTRLLKGAGCFGQPNVRFLVFCQRVPVQRFVIKLGPLDDKLKIRAEVPRLPKLSFVDMGAGNDGVQGGKNNERIDTGKGNDTANPGKGKDKVNLGTGNDKANTRDGQPDTINGGKGKDVATVDKQDKVKNAEVVKRK